MNTNLVEQRLIEKIRKLSSPRIVEIEDFIDFLYQRENQSDANLTLAATKLSEASFTQIWDNSEDAVYDNLQIWRCDSCSLWASGRSHLPRSASRSFRPPCSGTGAYPSRREVRSRLSGAGREV